METDLKVRLFLSQLELRPELTALELLERAQELKPETLADLASLFIQGDNT